MSAPSPDSAIQRNGPMPWQNSGRRNASVNTGISKARVTPARTAWLRIRLPLSKTMCAARLELSIACDVHADRAQAVGGELRGIALALAARVRGRVALRHVAVEQIVGGGLIGDDVRCSAARRRSPGIRRPRYRRAPRPRHAVPPWPAAPTASAISEGIRQLVHRAALQPLGGALAVDLDGDAGGTQHGWRRGVARTPCRRDPRVRKKRPARSVGPEARGGARQDFVSPLQHTLRPDVLPAARGQPAPADEPALLEVVEDLLVCPAADDVAVRHQHERRARVGREDGDRLARLDDQGLACRAASLSARDDRLVGGPVARRLAERCIDHQVLRILRHRQDILEQPQQPLLPPAPAAQSACRRRRMRPCSLMAVAALARAHSARSRCRAPARPADRRIGSRRSRTARFAPWAHAGCAPACLRSGGRR